MVRIIIKILYDIYGIAGCGNWFKRWYADCGYSFDRQA